MNKHELIQSISKPVDKLGRQRNASEYWKVETVFNLVTRPERPSSRIIASLIGLNASTVDTIVKKIKKAGYEIGKLRHNYNSHGYYVDMSDLINYEFSNTKESQRDN